QKDSICDGSDTRQVLQQFYENERSNISLKRHLTNHSQINEDVSDGLNDDFEGYQQQGRHRTKKMMNDRDDRFLTRTITNSNVNNSTRFSQPELQQITTNNKQTDNNRIHISNYALNYASDYHLQPILIECNPRLKDQKEGAHLVHSFSNYIKNDFLTQNPMYRKPIQFDVWWIDSQGNLHIITKETDIYIYLSKIERYPVELNNIKLQPYPPSHLPPQHTAIIKWVKNSISFDDIKEELEMKYKSLFKMEEMIGTMNERNRHIKIEISDKNEYNSFLYMQMI
ncbi:unnamed protein product, partial [Didymodactylos carnosus]